MTIDTYRNRVVVRLANAVLRLTTRDYRKRLKHAVATGLEANVRTRTALADWQLDSHWARGDDGYYAEIGIQPDDQRLVAHASNTSRTQIAADLRALSVAAAAMANEIEPVHRPHGQLDLPGWDG